MSIKNGSIRIENTDMDYIAFGSGSKNLIMIPGLGDGLKTVKGMALPFALMYCVLLKTYRVYVFSRRNKLPAGFSTRDMAEDLYRAMEQLQIKSANVLGVSQGGMIAQWLAIDHPEVVEKLILTVTLSKPNETVQNVVHSWIAMAQQGDYKNIMLDTAEKSYTEETLRKSRWMYRIVSNFGKPASLERFLIQADSCLTHDAYGALEKITCPTLIIGGKEDRIVTGKASEEMAEKIAGSNLYLYEGYGHGLYEEAKDFLKRVTGFIEQEV